MALRRPQTAASLFVQTIVMKSYNTLPQVMDEYKNFFPSYNLEEVARIPAPRGVGRGVSAPKITSVPDWDT